MLKNAGLELNLESDKIGHLVFMGQSDSELFSLPNWEEWPFSAPFQYTKLQNATFQSRGFYKLNLDRKLISML